MAMPRLAAATGTTTDEATLLERLAKVPYVGLVMPKVPYYIFVGSRDD